MSRTAECPEEPIRSRGRKWRWLALVVASWPCWTLAAHQPGKVEILKRGAEPESRIQYRPVEGASQQLAWEWTSEAMTIRSNEALPAGEPRSVRGVWEVHTTALEKDGFACRRSLTVNSAEPAHPVFDRGFSEAVVKDLRGLTRSIETDGSVVRPYGMHSPWFIHRALDIVFPDRPVGLGAQWGLVRKLELDDGLSVDVEAIYELKKIAADHVGIVYSLDAKRVPVPMKYAKRVIRDPTLLARNRLYVSFSCAGRAFQYLSGCLPNEADLVCQVKRETKAGNTWATVAEGEQILIKVRPVAGESRERR